MKSLHLVFTTVFLTLLIISFSNWVPASAAQEEEILVLIETADTPEDHIKIAEYYNGLAEQMEIMASQHESMGKAYKKRSKPMSGMSAHCANLSNEYKKSADQYRAMAKEHEDIAHGMMDHDSQ